jgi:hypothetical protein
MGMLGTHIDRMGHDKATIGANYDAARGYRPDVLRQWLDLIASSGT